MAINVTVMESVIEVVKERSNQEDEEGERKTLVSSGEASSTSVFLRRPMEDCRKLDVNVNKGKPSPNHPLLITG